MRERLGEYRTIVICAVCAAAFGACLDLVTSQISWEYFFYGKNLRATLGPDLPPNPLGLAVGAAKIGASSSWWVGALLGLTAPSSIRRVILRASATVLAGAALGGVAGFVRWIPMTDAVAEVATSDLLRPARYVTVYGTHLGAYCGAAVVATTLFVERFRATRD